MANIRGTTPTVLTAGARLAGLRASFCAAPSPERSAIPAGRSTRSCTAFRIAASWANVL
jgi:hypothetical protein